MHLIAMPRKRFRLKLVKKYQKIVSSSVRIGTATLFGLTEIFRGKHLKKKKMIHFGG